jgi:hypothetical protein
VLFLTTLIGAGQGLFLALVTVQLCALFDLLRRRQGTGSPTESLPRSRFSSPG